VTSASLIRQGPKALLRGSAWQSSRDIMIVSKRSSCMRFEGGWR